MRTVLAAVFVAVASACASAPSGHYHFALAADQTASRVWSLASLPPHGRIDLAAQAGPETNPRQSTHVLLRFADSDITFPLAAIDMDDPGCQGAYAFSLEYSNRSKVSQTEYFDRKLPWGAPLNVRLEWWPDGRIEIEIAGVGKRVLDWHGPGTTFEIRLWAGTLQVDELDYQNLSSS